MAAVFGCGFEPTQPPAMYSVLETGSSNSNSIHPRRNVTQIPGLDGADDQTEDNPFTRSISKGRRFAGQNVSSGNHRSNLVSCTNDTGCPDIHNDPGSDAEASSSSHRSKRRRLSLEDESQMNEEEHVRNGRKKMVGSSMFNTSSSIVVQIPKRDLCSVSVPTQDKIDLQRKDANAELNTPKKSTPRRRQAKIDIVSDGSANSTQEKGPDNAATPSRKKRATPKKKTLSVHTNGKLLSSPVIDKDLSLRTNSKTETKPASNRNFKMKNGKFMQSLEVTLRYGNDKDTKGREVMGDRIDAILLAPNAKTQLGNQGLDAKTHPFFLGKIKPKVQANDSLANHGDNTDNDSESTSRRHEPVPWKDIKFTSQKPTIFKSSDSIPTPWPPLSIQHVGREIPTQEHRVDKSSYLSRAKLKQRLVQLRDDEDILHEFVKRVKVNYPIASSVEIPQRHYLNGSQVASSLAAQCTALESHDAMLPLRNALVSGSSAFDRGECSGPNMWSLQYAPARCSEVLQPSASVLRQWLQNLIIHNVKSGIDAGGSARRLKISTKRKKRKQKDEFDDFLVDSDDDEELGKSVKTAILITGPNGCGKTASVFAVARELGFEVFEIHPGMRRGAKDIFDKVGDMAHNHLVQNGPDLSRGSSVVMSDLDTNADTDTDNKQGSAASLLGMKKGMKQNATSTSSVRSKKEQKQSLILFEEVDLLFEDDRGFWSGVQSLIKHSKRPVVMTCNDLSSIPIDELNLYDVLRYESIEHELAVDYLQNLAAAEGHILDRESLSTLYTTKRQDLRASITELNLWCQMTVGSKQGGLDWMLQGQQRHHADNYNGTQLRIFSQGTFRKSLDLIHQALDDDEAAIRFNQDALGIDAICWCNITEPTDIAPSTCGSKLQLLELYSSITEAQSVIDIMTDEIAPALASVTGQLTHSVNLASNRDVVAYEYTRTRQKVQEPAKHLISALEPITTEKPTFPPSQGRLAPSLDSFTSSIAIDIAPYVRSIVRFDKLLEEQRDEVFGSQGKSRKTRAARAAAEGGDKASTRSERWFPKALDFAQILKTGGEWPQWYSEPNNEL